MTDKLTLQKSIERERAKRAYQCAEEGSKIDKSNEYKAYVQKIPMLIKTNGLGAAFAFVKAKSSDDKGKVGYAYKLIYEQTTNWLKSEPKELIVDKLSLKKTDGSIEEKDLIEVLINRNSSEYRAVTNEVFAFFIWLKRFAEGLIEE